MRVKVVQSLLSGIIAAAVVFSPTSLRGQELISTISNIAKSDPLIITGALGTQNTYYHSSGVAMASPLSTSFYANLNINLYGISMPFSFYYSGDNSSFSYPQFHFSISPRYKGWNLLIGQKSMAFSPYVFSIPFNGVGIEYAKQSGHSFRFGAFYGNLKKAVNAEPGTLSGLSPQYRRRGWGVKLGYGTSSNYLDVYLFRAKDDISSIDAIWQDRVRPQENIAVGVNGRVKMGSHLSLSANFATSLLSGDTRVAKVDESMIKGVASDVDNIFNIRYSSQVRWAGDATLTTSWKYLNGTFSYRIVQPDYNSLGVSYITSNYQALTAAISTHVGPLSLSGSFSGQSDNLSGKQLFTTRGFVYNASASLPIGKIFSLSSSYNGYLQRQYDGAAQINDSVRAHRRTDSWTLSPSCRFITEAMQHGISLSGNYSTNRDLNPFASGASDVNTLAIGMCYNVMVEPIETSFSFNVNEQQSDGFGAKYKTDIYSFSTSRSFLKEKTLCLALMASYTTNRMKGLSSNNSLGGSLSATYTLHEVHAFSLAGSYNRYASTNLVSEQSANSGDDVMLSLSYNYTFSLIHIRRKAADGTPRVTSDFIRRVNKEALKAIDQKAHQTSQPSTKRY